MSHICANDEYLSLVYLHVKQSTFSVFIYRFFNSLSLRLRVDIFKVTTHERIQDLYFLVETNKKTIIYVLKSY
jgi:hypothetical protein